MGAIPLLSSIPRISLEEYLMQEESSSVRHEFHDGIVTMMAGGGRLHADAAFNWLLTLGNLADGGNCRPVGSDLGVWIASANTVLYPDVALYCGMREFRDGTEQLATNPKLIVEVLSPSTRDYDLAGKFSRYRELASLEQYICMEPQSIEVHCWTKQLDGEWLRVRFTNLSDEIEIHALGKCVRVEQVYAGLL